MAGLPTDRCIAEWWIASRAREGDHRRPAVSNGIRWRCASRFRRISRPSARTSRRARAKFSKQASEQFRAAFDRGLAVIGFEKSEAGRNLLTRKMGIRLEQITLREIRMPLVHFFETSFGRTTERHMVLVEVESGGVSGWGEVTAGENPFYNEEWTESAWLILRDYVAPRVLRHDFESAAEVGARTAHIRGHNMARGGLEVAVWDLEARMLGQAAVSAHRRRRAARDSLRRFDRHPGFRAAAAAENRNRTRGRLSAHQDEDQARLGCGSGARSAEAISRTFC